MVSMNSPFHTGWQLVCAYAGNRHRFHFVGNQSSPSETLIGKRYFAD